MSLHQAIQAQIAIPETWDNRIVPLLAGLGKKSAPVKKIVKNRNRFIGHMDEWAVWAKQERRSVHQHRDWFEAKTGILPDASSVYFWCKKHGIPILRSPTHPHADLCSDDVADLYALWVAGTKPKDLVEVVKERFGLDKTRQQIGAYLDTYKKRHQINNQP